MLKKRFISFLICFATLIYLETVVRFFTVGSFDLRFLYVIAFAAPTALLLIIPTLFSNKKLPKIIYNCLIAIIAIYFCVQLVYYNIFNGFLSLSLIGVGADAMGNFTTELFAGIRASAVGLILIALVIPASIVLSVKNIIFFSKTSWKRVLIFLLVFALVYGGSIGSLFIGGTGAFTVYDTYFSSSGDSNIERSVQNLGILVTARIEIQNMIFGSAEKVDDDPGLIIEEIPSASVDATVTGDNMLDIDFEELKKLANGDESVENILATVDWRGPTNKNEYTGIFEGYNLIMICAESFSPYVIDKDLTPTLYKLSTEGFVFENFYASFESVTTDGEFSYCLGMFPNLSLGKYNSSFKDVKNSSLPYSMGNIFKAAGANTYAYHNNEGTFYGRNESHPNLGYDVFKTPDTGLEITDQWPASDLEMFTESVDDYINDERFHAYYMTFSGHHQYNWVKQSMCIKNRDAVDHLDYSETVKAYLAANLELENSLTYLIERLEEKGIADKTVIALTTDHYPYGLNEEQLNELAGKEIDQDFGKYKSSFICWSASMKESVVEDKLCSTIDILPTLLNLFGFEFDSRFVIGRDIFSDYEGIAMLSNQSFITDKFMFNAVDNEVIMLTDEEVPEEEIENKKNLVIGTMGLSRTFINTDIYKYLEEYLATKE